jgi:hypothetical protein
MRSRRSATGERPDARVFHSAYLKQVPFCYTTFNCADTSINLSVDREIIIDDDRGDQKMTVQAPEPRAVLEYEGQCNLSPQL